jgi:hypothetical protein
VSEPSLSLYARDNLSFQIPQEEESSRKISQGLSLNLGLYFYSWLVDSIDFRHLLLNELQDHIYNWIKAIPQVGPRYAINAFNESIGKRNSQTMTEVPRPLQNHTSSHPPYSYQVPASGGVSAQHDGNPKKSCV